jgi:hypothetical protein
VLLALSTVALSLHLSLSSDVNAPSTEAARKDDVEKKTEALKSLSLRVIELTSKNYASSVGDGNVWLIEFYTPW